MSVNLDKQKVLVVDDSSENIELLDSMLNEEYEILFSTSGKKALQIAEDNEPDLILLDIVMPDMDGFEVITVLKENAKTRGIPVIFLTAKTDKIDLLKGFNLGSIDYIGKPFFEEEVKARLKTHLDNRQLIKQLESANKKLEQLSLSDPLTGIANRRYFDQFLAQMFSITQREHKPLSLLIIDVDFFKKFNDCYGHYAGDQCLQAIANTLDGFANRGGDLAARYGGEEFGMILADTSSENAEQFASNCRMAVEELDITHAKSSIAKHITISVGITTLEGKPGESIEQLLLDADKALYQAKNKGRNQICIYPPLEI